MVMVDLGIPPGFELLSDDLDACNDGLKLSFRLRAKYPIRARTFASQVYEYYDPAVSAVARPVQLEVRKK